MTTYAQIAVPSPLNQSFTYRIPLALAPKLRVGQRVIVPFRRKEMIGFLLGFAEELPPGLKKEALKEIIDIKEEAPVFSKNMLQFLEWLADYYSAPIGEVCKAAFPPPKALPRLGMEEHTSFHHPETLELNSEQNEALKKLLENLSHEPPKPVLLHGITGSGKTEVYLQCIKEVLRQGKQAILLTPEISLTPQLIGRVESRLKEKIAIYHSGLSPAWRYLYWEKMRAGELRVVVGTRSALFAPLPNLGAIIVDEEHDASYKQGEGSFHYHARDAAIVRAQIEKAAVILGSATPSLESFHNAKKGKYHYVSLSKRATGASLPEVTLIDLCKEKFAEGSKTLSLALKEALSENLYRGDQSLLFLNRRGFANFLLCEDCGEVLQCLNCAISLTYHKFPPTLVCHYCNFKREVPEQCGRCGSSALKLLGQGTQTLEEELKNFFPKAAILRLDKDTANKRGDWHLALRQMKKGEADILLGTQLVAKGHDFPNVTLVGVVLADTSLLLPDFRAAERTFQILTQVAGRSGRGEKPGKVFIQTFHPEHFSLLCSKDHNFETFSQKELESRALLNYPPFSRLAQIRLHGRHAEKVERAALSLKRYLTSLGLQGNSLIEVLGPSKAPLSKLKGRHRFQILLKAKNANLLKNCLKQIQGYSLEKLPSSVQLQIDVDCLNMM